MGTLYYFLYNAVFVPVFCFGFWIGSLFNAKMKEGRIGRKNLFRTIKQTIEKIDAQTKRIHFHASSVGEWEQAVPIIAELKKLNPKLFISVSFFSPSGFRFAKKPVNVDLKVYLPFDRYRSAKRFFNLIRPDLWIISKFDIWPNHVIAANRLGIPIAVTAATLSPNSGRDKGISGKFNKFIYSKISQIFAISDDDKDRFKRLISNSSNLYVTGDTRFDQVYNKGERAKNEGDVKLFKDQSGIKIIGGSIWPADEKHLIPALIALMKKYDHLKLILVPHELHESHISAIENMLNVASIDNERFTNCAENGGTHKRVIIVNTIGLLSRLYMQTDIAYIGGSFSTGVHNVMEPAVFGQPVLFGPQHLNSFEAGELLKLECAFCVENRTQLESILDELISNQELRTQTGTKAKNLIYNNLGATNRIINILKQQYGFISQNNTD